MENLKSVENLEKVEKANKAFQIIANMPKNEQKALIDGLTASFELVGIDPYSLGEKVVAIDEADNEVTLPGVESVW